MDIKTLNGLTSINIIEQKMAISKEDEDANSFKQMLEDAVNSGQTQEIKKAAQEVEAYFINNMFKQMRSTVMQSGGFFEKSYAQSLYQEMLDEEYAKISAEAGGIGLADSIVAQLTLDLK